MPALGRTDSRARMALVLLAFALVAVAASVRLGQWQVVEAATLSAQHEAAILSAKAMANKTVRADIIDRDGVVMAKTSSFDQLVAHPKTMDPDRIEADVALLAALLDLKPREEQKFLTTLTTANAEGKEWISLASKITLEQSELVLDAKEEGFLDGFGLTAHQSRHYPRKGGEPGTSLASHVLGFVQADGRGVAGVEAYFEKELSTVDPETVDVASIDGTAISLNGLDPEPLELSIDAKLQKQVEKELYTAYTANKAKGASAIVMDPETGAILAAASVPAYDAEDFAAIAGENMNQLRNRVFSDQYEPGSVMKIFTATAALDLGVVTPNTLIRDENKLEFWKYTVRNADHGNKGDLKVKDVIARSRNVATAKIAKKLAPNSTQKAAHRLYDLWAKVGLTERTQAGVTGEGWGSWCDPDDCQWAPVDLANRAFGQAISVTLPQLARGLSTVVNGGKRVQPYLVKGSEQARVEPERVLTAKTARQAKDILRHVTGSVPWYARGSLIPGYDIGGKTGTAQIWNSKKHQWKQRRFNHSFIGFVGGRKKEYVIAVRLEEPVPIKLDQGVIPLRIESYELFQMVARATIDKMGMKKSRDPEAGRPIIGTEAARVLTPERNRVAVKTAKQTAKKQAQKAEKAKQAEKAKRKDGEVKLASDPAAEQSDDGET